MTRRTDGEGVAEVEVDERLGGWHPTSWEVDEILRELRPIINEFARRDHDAIAAELARRQDRGTSPR